MLNAGPPSTPHLQWSHLHRRLFSVALGILFWRIFVDSQEMCTGGGRGRQGEAGEVGGGRGRQDEAREKNQESWERGGSDVHPGSVLLSQALPLPHLHVFKPYFSQSHLSKWTNYLAYVQE